MIREYVCEACGGTFTTDVPESEVDAEYLRDFGAGDEPPGIVCDGCYKLIIAAYGKPLAFTQESPPA